MIKEIARACGMDVGHWSSCRDGDDVVFKNTMEGRGIRTALEIGTHWGISALAMSKYCDRLITIDCVDYPERTQIWEAVKPKNVEFMLVNDDSKKTLIDGLDFDFVFIDGCHMEGVFLDFELCKKCKRILFHDYSDAPGYQCVKQCVDKLPKSEVTFFDGSIAVFALWEHE